MTRRAVVRVSMAVVAVVAALAVVGAPAAVAEQDPVYIPRDGEVVMKLHGTTSGLLPVGELDQAFRWRGDALVAIPSRPTPMTCNDYGESDGSVALEVGEVTLVCSGSGPNGPASLNCSMALLRVGAVASIHGNCSLTTPTKTYPLTAEGQLGWVPVAVQGQLVKEYELAGTMTVIDWA